MRIRIAVPEEHVDPEIIDAALEAVTRLDESLIREGKSPTSHDLVRAGARWRPEPPGDEHFDHGGTIATRGWGDCDDWAPLHAATLRASGTDPGAIARVVPSGPSTYHAIVERSNGAIEDPSAMAGMKSKASSVVGAAADGTIQVWALDPHDGRVYEGALAPTVGPLSVKAKGSLAVRGVMLPDGPYYEARVDVPVVGSALMTVRGYERTAHHRSGGRHYRGRRVVGATPYALACIGHGGTIYEALDSAIVGAVLCGDAAEMTTSLDRYKLLAMQAALKGLSPGQVRELLQDQIMHDVHAKGQATGSHPQEHVDALAHELQLAHGIVIGWNFFENVLHVPDPHIDVSKVASDVGHIATAIVSKTADVVNTVAKAAGKVPWGDIVHLAEAAVSVVPGLGTAVSEVVAAAETAFDSAAALLSGHPLTAAIDAAENFAMAAVPGAAALRPFIDPVKGTLLGLVEKKEPIESAVLDGILTAVPDKPSFGSLTPRSVAASLGHLIVGHLGMRKSPPAAHAAAKSVPTATNPAAVAKAIATVHAKVSAHIAPPPVQPIAPLVKPAPTATHPLARDVAARKPPGTPHAAVHADAASMPGTPGAPPGATHWSCLETPGGPWLCRWI